MAVTSDFPRATARKSLDPAEFSLGVHLTRENRYRAAFFLLEVGAVLARVSPETAADDVTLLAAQGKGRIMHVKDWVQ